MSKETDRATPTPWAGNSASNDVYPDGHVVIDLDGGDGTHVADIYLTGPHAVAMSNAALIVRAVNAHDKLVEACEADLRLMGNLLEDLERIAGPAVISGIMGRMRLTRATLALAKGEVKL